MIYRLMTAIVFLGMIFMLWKYMRSNGSGLLNYFQKPLKIMGFLRLIGYLFILTGVLILSISAMIPVILGADHLTGIMLIVHVTFAPALMGVLFLFLILTGHLMTFNRQDFLNLRNRSINRKDFFWQKVIFWIFSTTLVVAAGTIILMLFPLFGTDGQKILLDIHRITALGLVTMAAWHFWLFKPNKT